MTIYRIYTKYNVIPALQVHMLRVASVAKIICDNLKVEVDDNSIITACLFHDVGNIIKFDLSYNPDLLKPKSKEYWEKIKHKFIEKYGKDERKASYLIAKECGIKQPVLDLICSVGFIQSGKTLESNDLAKMICLYSDARVSTGGVVAIDDRFLEGIKRHMANKQKTEIDTDDFELHCANIRKIEKIIFSKAKIKPAEITNDRVNHLIDSPFLIKYSL